MCGAVGAVAGFIFGQHFDRVGMTTQHVVDSAVMLICLADADVTRAAHYSGVKLNNMTCRLPGNIEHTVQAVKAVLYVLWHTGSWKCTESGQRNPSIGSSTC